MALFGNKEEPPAQPPVQGQIPVQEVVNMKGQGLTNNQIIQNLQREGYKSHQIFDAMNQADLHLTQGGNPGAPAEPQQPVAPAQQPPANDPQMSPYYQNESAQPWPGSEQPQQPQQPVPPHDPFSVPVDEVPPADDPFLGQSPDQPMQQQPAAPISAPLAAPAEEDSVDRIEEVAEAIIDEKWSELMKHIQKVIDWKGRVDARIVEMENKFGVLEEQFNKLHEGIIGKIEDYDQNMRDVGTEIKGMEKVFQKIIPELSSNVAELSKLTDTIKDETKKKKK